MDKMFNVKKFDEVSLIDPVSFKARNKGENEKYISLNKEIQREIYKNLGFSSQTSKKIYDISTDVWRDVVNLRSQNTKDGVPLDIEKYNFVSFGTDENEFFVSITHSKGIESSIEKFEKMISDYGCTYFVNREYVLQVVIPIKVDNEDITPVLVLDIDLMNGLYRGYNGVIKSDGNIILSSKPVIQEAEFSKFLSSGFEYELRMSAKLAESICSKYDRGEASKIHLSVKEVIDILGRSKIDIITDPAGNIESIIGTSYADKFRNFFNSFNMPFKSLKKLSFLRKSLKQNSLTLSDMVDIVSEEFFSDINNCNGLVISELLKIYYSMEADSNVISEELKVRREV